MSAISKREILFILKMQNQSSKAIKEMVSDFQQITAGVDKLNLSTKKLDSSSALQQVVVDIKAATAELTGMNKQSSKLETEGAADVKQFSEGLKRVKDSAAEATKAVKDLSTESRSIEIDTSYHDNYAKQMEQWAKRDAVTAPAPELTSYDLPAVDRGQMDQWNADWAKTAQGVYGYKKAVDDARIAIKQHGPVLTSVLEAYDRIRDTAYQTGITIKDSLAKAFPDAAAAAGRWSETIKSTFGSAADGADDAVAAVDEAGKKGAAAADQIQPQESTIGRWLNLKNVIIGTIAAIGGNQIIQMTDQWKQMSGQLKLVTEGEANFLAVREKVIDIAKETRSDLKSTSDLYTRLAHRAEQLGMSQQDTAELTTTLSQAMQVGGSSAEEAAASLRQFSQALGRGELRGDELTSIIENAPGLAKAFEDGLRAAGKEVMSLKQYIQDAEPTMQELLSALKSQAPEVAEQFAQLPLTVGQGMSILRTGMVEFVGKVDEASKASDGLAKFLANLGNIITSDGVIGAFATLANIIGGILNAALNAIVGTINLFRENMWLAGIATAALAGYLTATAFTAAPGVFKKIADGIKAAYKATLAWNSALLKNPMVLLATVIAAIIGYLYVFRNEIKFSGEEAYTLGEVVTGVFIAIKEIVMFVAGFIKDVWNNNISDIQSFTGKVFHVIFQIILSPLKAVKAVVNGIITGFLVAYHTIKDTWKLFPAAMADFFTQAVNWAIDKINKLVKAGVTGINLFISGLRTLGLIDMGNLEVGGLDKMTNHFAGAGAAVGSAFADNVKKYSKDYVGGILDELVASAGQRGRAAGGDGGVEPGSLSSESGEAMELNKKDDGKGDKANNDDAERAKARAEALEDLRERIKETNIATQNQKDMNEAIRKGPAAVRELNATLAFETELREQLNKLHEAGVDIRKGSEGATLAMEAATAAQNAELAKQAEALANLDYALGRNIQKMKEEQVVALAGLDIMREQNVERRRAMQREHDYDLKFKELTQGYDDAGYTPEQRAEADRKAGVAASQFAKDEEWKRDYETAIGLHDSMVSSIDRQRQAYDEALIALQNYASVHGEVTPEMAAAAARLKPPENMYDALQNGLVQYMDEIKPSLTKVGELGASIFNRIGDTIATMVTTGKANFGDLAKSIITDITQMIIKAMIFKALMSAFPGLGKFFPGMGATAPVNHTGGIAGAAGATRKVDPGVFKAARKYHTGGLAGQGSLPGEIPVIAKKNEAILPTVRLPDGNFGVKADLGKGGGGGGNVFAPQYNINIAGDGANRAGDLPPEMQAKLGAMLEEELNIHMQRKLDEWTRPGGQLSNAMRRR